MEDKDSTMEEGSATKKKDLLYNLLRSRFEASMVCYVFDCFIVDVFDSESLYYILILIHKFFLFLFQVFGAVGDAMGYRGGSWEFCFSGEQIHKELYAITEGKGIPALHLHGYDWRVSDGTI